MTSRRDFLTAAATITAAIGIASVATPAAAQGTAGSAAMPTNTANQDGRWRPTHRIGFGALPIGNAFFKSVPESQAIETVETAWNAGVRLYDTSPSYGFGGSERRLGVVLSTKPRDEFVLASKIGRVMEPDTTLGVRDAGQWHDAPAFKYTYDYSADGTRRSIEHSLLRLGVASLDIVFVHDLTPGNSELGNWEEHLEIAKSGAFPTLQRMKEEGIIKAWGMGVNNPEPILAALEVAEPDIMLAATQYTLVNHDEALTGIMPALEKAGASIMNGASLNAGFLAGRERFNYGGREIPAAMIEKRRKLYNIARSHSVDLRVAALQFAAAHPVVSCIIPGASSSDQVLQNVEALGTKIPADFWAEVKQQGIVNQNAPVPA
ncbi:aldo/keto reductase [Agrobacterium rubi]|uniref:aldo/keto reductase n=1 Tax=Agrobacterium rubi TaxID=28099 RepID=UPI0015738642|nr:aldo/keto reductase [Agrobacterium rubi]NTF10472.1 aldo/keto reductase [Agrobacterium rubi]NTF22866.1 aldo/keto reductase [Agrobacterium rubi]NTF29797.1 aldo/keto reductase [Agrobacterium rubi]